jgi:opacity protein-like surface antigen
MASRLLLVGGLAVGLAFSARAGYAEDYTNNEHVTGQPMVFAGGGGNNALRHLNDSNNDSFDIGSDFNTGYNFGGGVGIQLTRGIALRATYNYARSRGEGTTFSPIAGNHFNRHYYGADLQFRGGSGFSPYILIGGGAVTIDPDDRAVLLSPSGAQFDDSNFTKPAGKAGIGFEYQIPNTGFGVFAEGTGWAYKWDRYGFDRTQVDTNWGAGLTYRFGY